MIIEGFYKLLALVDYLIYSLASTMISVNIDIAGKEIFRQQQISDIANRIYIIVGVLMLFKLVISAIQYLINPDAFDDKEKGLTGLLRKTVISIVLMVLVPVLFDFMLTIQNTIVESIPNLIFGTTEQIDSQSSSNDMSFTVLSSFVRPNQGKGGSVGGTGEIHDLETFKDNVASGCGGGIVGDAKNCKYNYMILVSTLCGGFLCYVLLSMTLDVAIRTIKFSLIRVLAPIPISSYVFSKDKLNKFVKTALSVYFDLFIRLAIIYFIIFAVKEVMDSKMLENIAGNDNWFRNAIVNIAIIGGLFMFAKTAPKFISELLGLPDIGVNDMKDMFKPAWQRAGVFGAGTGMLTAATGNAINSYRSSPKGSKGEKLKAAFKAAGSGIAGAASAGFHGGIAAMQGKDTKEVNAAGYKRAIRARQNRDIDRMNDVGWRDRVSQRMIDTLGIDTQESLAKNQLEGLGKVRKNTVDLQGNYNKAIEKYASSIDVTQSAAFMSNLGNLLNQSRTSITNGNSQYLKDILQKFDTGQKISYAEVLAMRGAAAQPNSGGELISAELTKGMGTMKAMEKALWLDSMAGEIKDMSGNNYIALDASDPNNTALDTDVAGSIAKMRQDIYQNVLSIDGTGMNYLDDQGNVQTIDAQHAHDPKQLEAAFKYDFKKFDDRLAKQEQKIQGQVNVTSAAAARASIERRNANKDKK